MQPFCAANPYCNPLFVELQAAPGCASFCSSSIGQPSASMAARSWVASMKQNMRKETRFK